MTVKEINKTSREPTDCCRVPFFLFLTDCTYSDKVAGLTYWVAMSVILCCVTFLAGCNDIQGVHLTFQHQSPAHFLCSRIGVPYQSLVWGGELGFTGLLTCVLLLGKNRPDWELWTGVYSDLSAELVYLQMFQDWVLNRAVTLQEDALSSTGFFQTEKEVRQVQCIMKQKIHHIKTT